MLDPMPTTMKHTALSLILMLGLSLPGITHANTPSEAVRYAAHQTERLLVALQEGDRAAFIENSTQEFRSAMTQSFFNDARQKLAPVISRKSELSYIGQIRKGGYPVFLFRLRPEDGGDDALVSTTLRDGQVAGFFVN